jgi:hypothetical protein
VAVLILEAFNGTAPNLTLSGVPRVSVLNASETARRIALIPAQLVVIIGIVLVLVYNIVFVITASTSSIWIHAACAVADLVEDVRRRCRQGNSANSSITVVPVGTRTIIDLQSSQRHGKGSEKSYEIPILLPPSCHRHGASQR